MGKPDIACFSDDGLAFRPVAHDYVPKEGEVVFPDHVPPSWPSEEQIASAFPRYSERAAQMRRVTEIRRAIDHAAQDDETSRMVRMGVLRPGDLPDLAEINARLKLRGKEEIA